MKLVLNCSCGFFHMPQQSAGTPNLGASCLLFAVALEDIIRRPEVELLGWNPDQWSWSGGPTTQYLPLAGKYPPRHPFYHFCIQSCYKCLLVVVIFEFCVLCFLPWNIQRECVWPQREKVITRKLYISLSYNVPQNTFFAFSILGVIMDFITIERADFC